jgi:hypothetical protein
MDIPEVFRLVASPRISCLYTSGVTFTLIDCSWRLPRSPVWEGMPAGKTQLPRRYEGRIVEDGPGPIVLQIGRDHAVSALAVVLGESGCDLAEAHQRQES